MHYDENSNHFSLIIKHVPTLFPTLKTYPKTYENMRNVIGILKLIIEEGYTEAGVAEI
jgi:hypothetical protein